MLGGFWFDAQSILNQFWADSGLISGDYASESRRSWIDSDPTLWQLWIGSAAILGDCYDDCGYSQEASNRSRGLLIIPILLTCLPPGDPPGGPPRGSLLEIPLEDSREAFPLGLLGGTPWGDPPGGTPKGTLKGDPPR